MARNYNLQVDNYAITAKVKGSNYQVSVNGEPYQTFKVGKSSYWLGHNEDFPIALGDRNLILAVRGRKARMAEAGRYIDNGEEYKPVAPLPKWIWIFIVLNALIPIVSFGGALNAIIGLAGLMLCASVARAEKMAVPAKLIVCLVITICAWAVWLVINMLLAGLIY